MKNWEWKNVLVGLFLIVFLLVIPAVMVYEGVKIRESSNATLPRIEIVFEDESFDNLKENSKDEIYQAKSLSLIDKGEKTTFSDVEVKGRGNYTWGQAKKPLQVKLSHRADLLGLGKRKKWILLANYVDPTNLRTDTAFYIEKMLDEKFAYEGRFVDLFVDKKYKGLYYLTRGIEIDKNAVDLKNPLGILVELDNIYAWGEPQYYVTSNGEHLTVKDVVNKSNEENAMNDFLVSFNKLELAVRQQDYDAVRKIIDVESFARYYVLEEFIANQDAYFTSQYFHKDGPEDKIHAGPAWDFDIALNLFDNAPSKSGYTEMVLPPDYLEEQYANSSRLFVRLLRMPEFRAEVEKVFQERFSGRKEELLAHIRQRAEEIHQSAIWDGNKWEKQDYIDAVNKLMNWVNERYDYFEEIYGQDGEISK